MLRFSPTTCQRLLVLLTIGIVATLPILTTANTCFVLAESIESPGDGEDVELDESLNLVARLCEGPKQQPRRQQNRLAEESIGTNLVLATIHFERGPPVC